MVFAAESSVHQTVKIILLRRAFEQEGIARLEKRIWAGLRIRQILLLKLGKALCFQNRYSAFVKHIIFVSSPTF